MLLVNNSISVSVILRRFVSQIPHRSAENDVALEQSSKLDGVRVKLIVGRRALPYAINQSLCTINITFRADWLTNTFRILIVDGSQRFTWNVGLLVKQGRLTCVQGIAVALSPVGEANDVENLPETPNVHV